MLIAAGSQGKPFTEEMIALTTKLNKPGVVLSQLDSVHALTDVTGFGLAGH